MNTDKIIARVKTHPNVSDLARNSGVSRRALTSIREGKLPTMRTLVKLSDALWPRKKLSGLPLAAK
jgi:DNA-binding phage protein